MSIEESAEVSSLMQDVFMKYQGPVTSDEGKQTFLSEFSRLQIEDRIRDGDLFLISLYKEEIVGMIAVRDSSHIFGLFVRPDHHNTGIATLLWKKALEICLNENNERRFTVNSSEYAVSVYTKWGFTETNGKQEKKGIEYIPMELCVAS